MTLTLHATDDRLSGEVLARWRAQTRRFSAACFVQKAPSGGTRPLLCPCELRTLRGVLAPAPGPDSACASTVRYRSRLVLPSVRRFARGAPGDAQEWADSSLPRSSLGRQTRGTHRCQQADVLCDVLQSLARFGHEHECETADSRIERPLWIDQPSVRVEELDIVDTLLNTASPRPLGRQRR